MKRIQHILFGIALGLALPAHGQTDEYKVKFAIVSKLLEYVTWPDTSLNADNNIRFGVYGHNPFGDSFEAYTKYQPTNSRKLVPLIVHPDSIADVALDVLFISNDDKSAVPEVLEMFKNRTALIITECNMCGTAGASVNLYEKDDKVRFEINILAIEQDQIDFGAQIYRLAKIIKP